MLAKSRCTPRLARLGLAVVCVVFAACSDRPIVGRAGPNTPTALRDGDKVERNGACATCHGAIAQEWQASLHRQAHSDPVYRRAFALEPLPFCTACHAPEADAVDPGPSPVHALGVGCITCHGVLPSHGTARAPAVAARTQTSECAFCHEFTFPRSSEKLQLTATEHRDSRAAHVACTTCHMPRVGADGHASHRFDASRDPAFVKSAARIAVNRSGRSVSFRFTPDRVGHAFPTGDLFRRLRVVVELEDRTRVEVFLGRKTIRAESVAAANAADDRPFRSGEPAVIDVDIGDGAPPLMWRVLYERVEHPLSLDEREAVVEGAIEVASGHF